MTWVTAKAPLVSVYGWAAVVLVAFLLPCLFVLTASAFLFSWRYFRPISGVLSSNTDLRVGDYHQNNRSSPNTKANALSIRSGIDKRFQRIETFQNCEAIRRVFYVAVHNGGDGLLSDCKLIVKTCVPPVLSGQIPAALDHGFTLIEGSYKFIAVLGLDEQSSTSRDSSIEQIKIWVPQAGRFLQWMDNRFESVGEGFFHNHVGGISSRMQYVRGALSVWVDENGRLRMEPA